MQNFGTEDYRTTIINTIFSIALIIIIILLKRTKYYGLTKVNKPKKYWYEVELNPGTPKTQTIIGYTIEQGPKTITLLPESGEKE